MQDRGRRGEGRHYSAFGFLQVGGGTVERFLEYWYMHIYVDEEVLYTGVYCGTSANNSFRRNITAKDMKILSIGKLYLLSEYFRFHGRIFCSLFF